MRKITAVLYEVAGDKGNEKPTGPCLGHIGYYPNLMVHDQTDRILSEVNIALRVDEKGNLKEKPDPDYTHAKLIRYTGEYLVYEMSYQTMEVLVAEDRYKGTDVAANRRRTVKHRYIIVKQ